jgi:hypothetical protein
MYNYIRFERGGLQERTERKKYLVAVGSPFFG